MDKIPATLYFAFSSQTISVLEKLSFGDSSFEGGIIVAEIWDGLAEVSQEAQ